MMLTRAEKAESVYDDYRTRSSVVIVSPLALCIGVESPVMPGAASESNADS